MVRQPVQSSNIAEVGHDPRTNTLEVAFHNGRVYRYGDVNVDEYAALLGASSIGSYFSQVIKPVKAGTIVPTDVVTGADANG
jgi:hypothetical protein